MTREEFIAALRARFIAQRPEFPEVAEMVRNVSEQRLLEAHAKCAGCGRYHFTPEELVSLAARFDDLGEFFAESQKLALKRVPKRCLDETDRIHAEIMGSRN